MKKYLLYLICVLYLMPIVVLGKTITCANGDYSADISFEKSELLLEETEEITVESEKEIEKITYTSKNKLIVEVTDDGIIKAIKPGSTNIIVNIQFDESTTCESNFSISVPSNVSSLKKLTLEEYDMKDIFKSDVFDYEITLPRHLDKINILATPDDTNAEIKGDGRRYLSAEGENIYKVTVTASDKSETTYTIKINLEEANTDNSLKNLIVEGYVISPKFNKDTTKYTLSVNSNVSEINIKAETNYKYAEVVGDGIHKLATGENSFAIKVIAEDGSEKEYELVVTRKLGESRLETLSIDNYKLDKQFKSEEFVYKITAPSNTDKLIINAKSSNNEKIEIIGNSNFKPGENNVFIKVSSKEKGATTYKIIVNKLSVEEQKQKEKNDILLTILLYIFIFSIVITAILIFIFLKRNYKKRKKLYKIKK